MGTVGTCPVCREPAGPLSARNFVSLSLPGIRSTRLPAQTDDPQARADGGPAEALWPRERPLGPRGTIWGVRTRRGLSDHPPRRARALPTAARRSLSPHQPHPPNPTGSPRHAPRPRGGPDGPARAPRAAFLRRVPGAEVRPSRDYITGPDPSGAQRGTRGPRRRRRGCRRSPAIDALRDPVPL